MNVHEVADRGLPSIGLYYAQGGEQFPVHEADLKRFAERWAYVCRKRRRWRSSSGAVTHLRQQAQKDLQAIFGIPLDFLSRVAKSGLVEVDFGSSPGVLDAGAAAPWELILSLATEHFRSGSVLLVIRRIASLATSDSTSAPSLDEQSIPQQVLIVTSAPGLLGDCFSFEIERKLLEESFKGCRIHHLENPDLVQLKGQVSGMRDAVVHFSGVSESEGARILFDLPNNITDFPNTFTAPGFYLAGTDNKAIVVGPQELASATATPERPPLLVAFNCYDSGSHLSSLVARSGARFAIGIQDELDNPLLEKFFANFYQGWTEDNGDRVDGILVLLKSFWKAILALRDQSNHGYVVLWSRHPVRDRFAAVTESLRSDRAADAEAREAVGAPSHLSSTLHESIQVDIRPYRELNYSMLHNQRSMFSRFVLKAKSKLVTGIQIEIALHVRGESYHYKTTCDIKDYFHKLDRIQVSLTSELLRSLRESVFTTLYVRVSHEDRTVSEITEKVRLLPVNEWQDSKKDGVWLPSFVLPYDPAIEKIIDRAQKYLKAILDDSKASFDGYQSLVGKDDYSTVHAQVRAIWAALANDFRLEYISPPPTFTEQGQRLRTPSDVVREGRGTCIDLTLLLSSCLEHVEIRPVLFLLTGHAFPGYFRSPSGHRDFVSLFSSESLNPYALDWRSESQPQPWVLEADAYHQILDLVRRGEIVPLETIWLTRRQGVTDAYEQGRRNLSNRARFECIHDVRQARINNVTPLPIGGASP